ncbi:MAG TPA: DUF2188 domain-containing protein [Caulobacteraceae bacterium]|jgi:hypothetical protein|nr:DUF2188 domain-containing protein [Caulobacteraceae bacterium]
MSEEHYRIVEHDGGWAYTALGVFSETFPTRQAALAAARRVVAEQAQPDRTAAIQYQDETGAWRLEIAPGDDRPIVDVEG